MNQYRVSAKYRQLICAFLLFPIIAFAQLPKNDNLTVGAENVGAYLPLLYGKKVALVANQTSVVGGQHLADLLLERKVQLVKVFSPEHGFRGKASAGEQIKDGKDTKTGLPIISLYGNNKKPTATQLEGLDVVVFDIQDVGARFYTYISTMSYVMEACAENNIKLIVLDRPNPNGYYVDGPVLKKGFESFVGMHPVPVVHGMTIGEYARMVNGEGWLANGVRCNLEVIPCSFYDHRVMYKLPIAPSPNLPNQWSIALYPSLCFFEGTNVSIGRGTEKPFQIVGAPYFTEGSYAFTPKSNAGAKNPKYEGQVCKGYDLTEFAEFYINGLGELYLYWLIEAYKMAPEPDKFFNNFFNTLAGTDVLQNQIKEGQTAGAIKASWQADLEAFKKIRSKYLLYRDFE